MSEATVETAAPETAAAVTVADLTDNPVYIGMVGGFELLVKQAAESKALREKASKAAGTTFLDQFNKSTDPEVVTLRDEINKLQRRINGYTDESGNHVNGLRDDVKVRMVSIGEISADAAQLDTYKERASEDRSRVRAQFDAFIKVNIIPENETKLRAYVESLARPILGEDRGRKSGGDSD